MNGNGEKLPVEFISLEKSISELHVSYSTTLNSLECDKLKKRPV